MPTTGVLLISVNEKMWKIKIDQNREEMYVQYWILKVIDHLVEVPVDEVGNEVSKLNIYFVCLLFD